MADARGRVGVTATASRVPFADLAAQLGATGPVDPCCGNAREEAFARFAAVGIPTSRDEEWRFTPVRHLGATEFGLPGESPALIVDDIAPFLVGTGSLRIVVVDGRVDPTLSRFSSAAGVRVASLAGAGTSDDQGVITCAGDSATALVTPFAALNSALWSDGAAIHVGPGVTVETPIEIVHVATAAADTAVISPRTVIYAAAGASATLVESFVGLTGSGYFTNAACEIVLGEGARLEHVRLQRENATATHIGITSVQQERGSHYRSFVLSQGARLSRHDLQARHRGEQVETLLYGLYLGRDDQLVDNHTAIFHDQPHCNSWEVYKGVLADRARGVFNGKVVVQPVAQRTDAKQTNRNLLLSDKAKIDTKPQLEIFADDVKCTHGATVGRLDESQRFYLRARGIAGREAQVLLVTAFVAEVFMEITDPTIRSAVERLVRAEMDTLID
jgi:Fe-S cluster assembly protein SufD